jgi:hypothetical protein
MNASRKYAPMPTGGQANDMPGTPFRSAWWPCPVNVIGYTDPRDLTQMVRVRDIDSPRETVFFREEFDGMFVAMD